MLVRDLDKKLDKDYYAEQLLPKNFAFWKSLNNVKSLNILKNLKK